MKVIGKKARDAMIEEAGETEGARRATGVFPAGAPPAGAAPEVEVIAKAERRRFTAEYKRRIVREADRCTKPGEIGALLRREALYSSHLVTWRAARDRGELEGLSPKKRGPKVTPPDPRDKRIAEQEREIARWQKRAERAEAFVEVQKKVAALLGTPFESEK
jgi:transposase